MLTLRTNNELQVSLARIVAMPTRKASSSVQPTTIPANAEVAKTDANPVAIEAFFLHFFTHVHMTATAMEALGSTGSSLTKHRILGFATMTPGISVGELVKAFRVSHQNLNEPLRALLKDGYLVAKIGVEDRRQKNLFATAKGSRLFRKVLSDQLVRLQHAFEAAGPEATRGFLEVHRHFVEPSDREWIARASAQMRSGSLSE